MLRPALLALLFALVTPAPSPAAAQSVGTSLSGPTTADGASPYINPASMGAAQESRIELYGGLAVLGLDYAPDERELPAGSGMMATPGPSSTGSIAPVVTLGGFTDALDRDWRLGLTVSVPRVSGGSWDRADGAGDITRYYLVSGAVFHIAAIPAVSWTPVQWFTLGLSANLNYGSVRSELDKDFGAQLNQTAGSMTIDSPFPYALPDLAAPVMLSGSGFGAGAIGGVLVRPIPELSFGASVHSPVILVGTGNLDVLYPDRLRSFVAGVLPTAVLPDLSAEIELDLDIPTIVIAGVSVRPHPMIEIAANYTFEHTSSQPNFYIRVTETTSESIGDTVKPQAYLDRHRVFLRFAVLPIPELTIAAHGIYQSNTIPENTYAPNNIDFHRVEVGLAARWRIVPEFSVMVQYSHLFLFDRQIDTNLHRPLSQPSLAAFNQPSPTGLYTAAADTIRLGVALHFDAGWPALDDEEAEPDPVIYDENNPSPPG